MISSCSVGFGAYSFNINLAFDSVCRWILQYWRLRKFDICFSHLLYVLQQMFWLQAYSKKVLAVLLHCCHEM